MKRITFVITLLLAACILQSKNFKKARVTSSCSFLGKYSYEYILSDGSAEFPLGFSLGLEYERGIKDNYTSGLGFSLLLPPKLINQEASGYFSDNNKLDLKGNLAVYHYLKTVKPIGRSNFYTKLNYGSGIPYFIYAAIGIGFEIGDKWSMETMLNYHLHTVVYSGASISYVGVKFGYSF